MKSLRTHIIESLEHENKICKKIMLKNKKALKNPQTEEFIVVAKLMVDIYDPPYSVSGRGITLAEAFDSVHDQFDFGNGSSKFVYEVEVKLKGGASLEVPHDYWKKYKWSNEKR